MALSRRTGQRFQASIWPGFVDAMTGLLLVLMFVLTIFMVVQFVLRETISGQESELNLLSAEIMAISEALGLEREKVVSLESYSASLEARLDTTQSELTNQALRIAELTSQRDDTMASLDRANSRILSFEEQVAGLLSSQAKAEATIASLENEKTNLLSKQEALNLALATVRTEIDQAAEEARRKAAERQALESLIVTLENKSDESSALITQQSADLQKLEDVLSEKEAARLVSSAAAEALREKFICFVGSKTGGMTTHFWQVPAPGIDAIQIDIEPAEIGRNYPLKAAVQGDAKTVLFAMAEIMDIETATKRTAWTARMQQIAAEWQTEYEPLLTSNAVPIRPERICRDLTDALPSDAFVVVDTGHAGMWMGGMFDVSSPDQGYVRSAGHLGWAFPAALGAKCALPNRPVVCFTGDAGFWYHIGEIETMVRWNINAVIVVNNNSAGNQSKTGFDRAYGGKQTDKAREIWNFTHVNFANVANEIGALGIRVEKPGDFKSALDQGLSAGRPVVIDVVTDVDAIAPVAVI